MEFKITLASLALVFERTSGTLLTIKLRGTDGTVRSVVLTLAP